MTGTKKSDQKKSDPKKGYYVYRRENHAHPCVTVLKVEGSSPDPWAVSVKINLSEHYIDSYHSNVEKAITCAKKIIGLLEQTYPGIYELS
jgi:hypothetical protein